MFTSEMIHRTQGLLDESFERYALVGRFVGDGARYKPRKTSFLNAHTYKVQHDMCEHGLRSGDPFRGEGAALPGTFCFGAHANCLSGAGPCFPELQPRLDGGEFKAPRRYVRAWVAAALARLERLRYGGISPD